MVLREFIIIIIIIIIISVNPSLVEATYRPTLGLHCGSSFITTLKFQITFTKDLRTH